MDQNSYPTLKQWFSLFFIILISFGAFLFLTLTLPQFFDYQLSILYQSIVTLLAPFIWLPIIIYLRRKTGIPKKMFWNLPKFRIIIILMVLAVSTKFITNPLYNVTDSIDYLYNGKIKQDSFVAVYFDLNMLIRFTGMVLVVPVFEEIFWRSKVLGLLLKNSLLILQFVYQHYYLLYHILN